jgi:hypothetical protein
MEFRERSLLIARAFTFARVIQRGVSVQENPVVKHAKLSSQQVLDPTKPSNVADSRPV